MEEIPKDLRESLERFNPRSDPRFWRALAVTIDRFRNGYRQASDDEPAYPTHNSYLMAKTRPEHKRRVKAARAACGKKACAAPDAASKLTEAKRATEAVAFRAYQTAQWRDGIQGLFVAWVNGTGRMPVPDHKRIARSRDGTPTGHTFNAFCLRLKDHLDPNQKDEALLTLAERLLDDPAIKRGQTGTIRGTLAVIVSHIDDPVSPPRAL